MRQKNSKNQQLLEILACNSANKPSFQNQTKWTIGQKGFLSDFEKMAY